MSEEPGILGYGEDALTLWALKHRLPEILKQLEDKASPSECLVFYRPSFGRAGGKGSAQFGEFDAIVASPKRIYLIESKWDNLKESPKKQIELGEAQKRRHQIMSWYVTHWNKKHSDHWDTFRQQYSEAFNKQFERAVPDDSEERRVLIENLQTVLNALHDRCKGHSKNSIRHVLLFFSRKKLRVEAIDTDPQFKFVNITYSGHIRGNFIKLNQSN